MKENYKKIIAGVLVTITLIRCCISFVQFNYKYTDTNGYENYTVKILNVEQESVEKKVYLVKLEQNNRYKDKFILNVYDNKDAIFSKGDILSITGKISIPQLLGNPRRV